MTQVTLILVVHNGEKFIRHTLDSVRKQTRQDFEVLVLDNASTDGTAELVRNELANINGKLIASPENIGPWAGFEKILQEAAGKYVVLLTDVILEPSFIERAVGAMERDEKVGALQAKIYQMELYGRTEAQFTKMIDTAGFEVHRSRKLVNKWHGLPDREDFNRPGEIFGVEGAVPVFRRSALEDCRIGPADGGVNWLIDPNYRVGSLGYGDDFDLAWRMRLFGWKQIYDPGVIAYHDRSTTKGAAAGFGDHLRRAANRRRIPAVKRRLDWSNVRFTILKNDYIINILRDLPYILFQELMVFGYTVLFEPSLFAEAGRFMRLIPAMLRTRRTVMRRARVSSGAMRRWFI